MKKQTKPIEKPTLQQLEQELRRETDRRRFRRIVRSTVYVLITVAAVSVLIATLLLPVLRVYGNSMAPTIDEGEMVVCVKTKCFDRGDIIAFYYNNRILLRRVIGLPGDKIDIDEYGNVYLNGEILEEPYVSEKVYETCDIELPFKVPDGNLFVMGDNRGSSVDSRVSAVGTVSDDQIAGKPFVCIWPFPDFRLIQE